MQERDAHYLHERKGLSAVLSPALERPRALSWIGTQERLLVATEEGELIEVDVVFGSRTLPHTVEDPAEMSCSPDGQKVVVVERAKNISLRRTSDGQKIAELHFPLLSDITITWFKRGEGWGVAVAGDDLEGRKVVLLPDDFSKHKVAKIPPRAAIGVDALGALQYGRVTQAGVSIVSFGKPLAVGAPSRHRLRFGGGGLLMGMAEGGVTLWPSVDRPPRTIIAYDVSAATLDTKGEQVAVGTRTGDVSLSSASTGALERARPGKVGGHSSAVRAMAFSARGRWLATAADELRVWTF
ncbi:MAG: hypothetical protein RIT28_690 [Pseudomonadota bacterium]